MNEKTDQSKIIFILGIMPRSGTHFLANLICQHPDCVKSVIPEDWLLESANLLTMYINRVSSSWELNIKWQTDNDVPQISHISPEDLLFENLGKGLMNFLGDARNTYLNKKPQKSDAGETQNFKRLVTKTPQTANLDKFFKLFPDEKLLIIVRDGRALTESMVKSFPQHRDRAIKEWAQAARRIFEFEDNQAANKDRFLIIKYEELHTDTKKEMRKILEFLKLDAATYDFNQALDLPVVGSSTFKRGEGKVHWMPVKKTEDFNPLARAANWTRAEHERFNYLAKEELLRFGYAPIEFGGNEFYWKIWNQYCDLLWTSKKWHKKMTRITTIFRKRLSIYFGK